MKRSPKPYTKEQVLAAMGKTKSVRAASRYLGCSYWHLKKWMKLYIDNETGKSLFEIHKNQSGKGIPKFLSDKGKYRKEPAVIDIIEGKTESTSFNPQKIKARLIELGFMEECCYRCGFSDRRVLDSKIPLILNFKDGVKTHWNIKNLELLCYNCFFLYVGNVYTPKDIDDFNIVKDSNITKNNSEFTNNDIDDLENIDEWHIKKWKELGIIDDNDKDDPYDLVSPNFKR